MNRHPSAREITIVGAGHVGLVTGACFAELGHNVTCVDVDENRISLLRRGKQPFYEPGLDELLLSGTLNGRLRFTSDYREAVAEAEFIFIAVATPTTASGAPELKHVRAAGQTIVDCLGSKRPIIVSKSTAPVGISRTLEHLQELNGRNLPIVANPEFLREGTAVKDFLEPDRVVLGSDDEEALREVGSLYEGLNAPILYTDMQSAEMVKYACNAFLATKISFINEIAEICERVGANITDVASGMGLDKRIGRHFLNAGIGFGGSCLPKDVKALSHMASVYGSHPQLLNAVLEINTEQRRRLISRLREVLGSLRNARIAVLGLAFKPETDDLRDAPALDLIRMLDYEQALVCASDPVAGEAAKAIFPELDVKEDPYEAAAGADALVIATEWSQFKALDLQKLHGLMRTPVIADGRNIFDAAQARANGFVYLGFGVPDEVKTPPQRLVLV